MHRDFHAELPTLIEVLRKRAVDERALEAVCYPLDDRQESRCSYGDLDRQARVVGGWLQASDGTGKRAILLFPPGIDFVVAFLGCLYGGVAPIALPAPNFAHLTRGGARIRRIAQDAQPDFVLTTDAIWKARQLLGIDYQGVRSLNWAATSRIDERFAESWRDPQAQGDELAFLQYTSGSTSSPRGVMVTHANLMHNMACIVNGFECRPGERVVNWLPHYHDMGLVGGILTALYARLPLTLISTLAFLKRPLRWLETISRQRAVISGAPNFAYDLCLRRIRAADRKRLDLSSWKVAFVGAEPVRATTLAAFTETFADYGFTREAFYPCYGLAEATLMASGGKRDDPPIIRRAPREDSKQGCFVHRRSETARLEGSVQLVSCGHAVPGHELLIVDPDTHNLCPSGRVGEIWLRGPSVARGYWGRNQETGDAFRGRLAGTGQQDYLRTGDLGFLADSELFIVGRLKDLIICNGSNHHPHDIELTAEQCHPAVRAGYCAAFSIDLPHREHVVIAAELSRANGHSSGPQLPSRAEVATAIRRAVVEHHDLQRPTVLLVQPGEIPRTTSGKIQRHACRQVFWDRILSSLEADGG